jgi:hypothetical protein
MNELLLSLLKDYMAAKLNDIQFPWGADNSVIPTFPDLPFDSYGINLFDYATIGAAEEWDRESPDFPLAMTTVNTKPVPVTATAIGGAVGTAKLADYEKAVRVLNSTALITGFEGDIRLQQDGCIVKIVERSHLMGLYGNRRNLSGFLNIPAADVNIVNSALDIYDAATTYDAVEALLNRELTILSARLGISYDRVRILTNPTLINRFQSLKQADTGISIMQWLMSLGVSVVARAELYSGQLESNGIGSGENKDRMYIYPINMSDYLGRKVSEIYQSPVESTHFDLRRIWYVAQSFSGFYVNNKAMTVVKIPKTTDVYPM